MRKYILTLVTLFALIMGTNVFAALSMVVTASPNPALINQLVTASVAINNTGSALNITTLNITASYNGSTTSRIPAAFSVFNIGPNSPNLVLAANATTTVPMQAVFFAPSTGVTGSGTGKFYIGANLVASDGSVTTAATSAALTVNPIALPLTQQ